MLKVMRNTITMAATIPIAAKTPPARGLFCRKDEGGSAALLLGLLVAPAALELEVVLGPTLTVTMVVLESGRVLVDSDAEEEPEVEELLVDVEDDRLVVVDVVDVLEAVDDEVEVGVLEDEDSVAVLEVSAAVEDEVAVDALWPGGRSPPTMLRIPPPG